MTPSKTRTATAASAPPSDAAPVGSPAATLAAALLGFFVVTLDAVILNVALPQIRIDLGGGLTGLQWVVDGYTLMFAALLLSAGAFADRVGARRAFGVGLVVFAVASAACGLAPSLGLLVLSRFVQGSSAAVLMPASLVLIGQAYPDPRRRARAVATWAMGGAVASTSGPILGGLLTLVSWRLVFLVNVPVVVAALLLLRRVGPSRRHAAAFDGVGQVTGVLAMAALTYAVIEAGAVGFGDPRVLVAIVVTVLAAAGFVRAERRASEPMVPPDLVRSRVMLVAAGTGFAFMVGLYGLPFLMSLFLQQQRGLSSLATGVVFLPMALVGLVLTPLLPRVVERLGPRPVVTAGFGLMTAGLVALALVATSSPIAVIAGLMAVVGLVGPIVPPTMTAVLLGAVPAHQAGTAGGILNTSRQLGGALAVAVFGALLAGPAGFESGLRLSLLLAALVGLAAAVVATVGLRPRSHP